MYVMWKILKAHEFTHRSSPPSSSSSFSNNRYTFLMLNLVLNILHSCTPHILLIEQSEREKSTTWERSFYFFLSEKHFSTYKLALSCDTPLTLKQIWKEKAEKLFLLILLSSTRWFVCFFSFVKSSLLMMYSMIYLRYMKVNVSNEKRRKKHW